MFKRAIDWILKGKRHYAKEVNRKPIPELCSKYIDQDIPVIFWGTIDMKTPHASSSWKYNGKTITWIAPLHCLLLVGYDDNNYIFNDPLRTQAPTYYSKEAVELAYNGISKQAMVLLDIEGPVQPPKPPAPVYKYGAVKNPVTGELYPVMVYENGKEYIDPAYKEEINKAESKPTSLGKDTFDWATFISGVEFEDSLSGSEYHPAIGGFAGMFIGGITSIADSWEHLYLDVHYYKEQTTEQKQAVIRCGASGYAGTFQSWEYFGVPQSLKELHGIFSATGPWLGAYWEHDVNEMAKQQYGLFTGKTPDDDYQYDVELTLNERRKTDRYVSQIFFGKDGKMYEYATIYPNEKVVIVVKSKYGFEVKERLDITAALNPVSELPADKVALFTIERQ